jgi:hypothetical protein
MMKLFIPATFLFFLLSACSNADPKKMAEELCNCVKSKKKISAEAKNIVMKAAKSKDFQSTYQEELLAIEDETEREEVQTELMTMMQVFQSKKTQQCAEAIDKKYKVYKSQEKEMQQKLVEEMENVKGCEVYAAVVKVGMKQQNKGGEDDVTSGDEEETPKKKGKVATEEED